jgi:hypothetical protein
MRGIEETEGIQGIEGNTLSSDSGSAQVFQQIPNPNT